MKDRLSKLMILIAILSVMDVAGIAAYFTDRSTAVNSVSIGCSQIIINENFENPDIEPLAITTITKKVTVENTGPNACAVRVKASFSDEAILDYADVDYNTDDWTYYDGYWYYNSVLEVNNGEQDAENSDGNAANCETTPLFNEVVLSRPTQEQIKDFDIYIYAECRNCSPEDNPMEIWEVE